MKVRDMERLAALLEMFWQEIAASPRRSLVESTKTLVEDEIFEAKRRGKGETPKRG